MIAQTLDLCSALWYYVSVGVDAMELARITYEQDDELGFQYRVEIWYNGSNVNHCFRDRRVAQVYLDGFNTALECAGLPTVELEK